MFQNLTIGRRLTSNGQNIKMSATKKSFSHDFTDTLEIIKAWNEKKVVAVLPSKSVPLWVNLNNTCFEKYRQKIKKTERYWILLQVSKPFHVQTLTKYNDNNNIIN